MSVLEKIKQDKVEALRNKDSVKKDLLGVIAAQAINTAMADPKNPSKDPSDAVVLSVIEKQIKSNEEVIEQIKDQNRDEMKNKLEKENEILSTYLPKKMTEEELKEKIRGLFSIVGGSDWKRSIGLVMKKLKEDCPGQYDGALASQITKELAGGQ